MKILITYATKTGTARSIAERIQARIIAAGAGSAIIEPVEARPSVDDFDAIIIGSCIHTGSWIKQGKKFVTKHATALHDNPKPTWAFSVGMPPENKFETEEKDVGDWLSKRIRIQGHKLFWGRVAKEDMGGCFNFFFTCFGLKYEDKRDWAAMDEWADGISESLKTEQQRLGTVA
ncbi:hypothetical protein VTL71DRAFT_12726 [Oculimacula yallundae]|uniref:Flavodoxin domain-containing protein n=1 Tax=Oculimacula yallundae TaxID=86028 RepID=A0ABR4CQK3_9HELO